MTQVNGRMIDELYRVAYRLNLNAQRSDHAYEVFNKVEDMALSDEYQKLADRVKSAADYFSELLEP